MENLLPEFYRAVRDNNEEAVLKLLNDGVDPNEPDWNNNGRPALVEAAYHGHTGMARILLKHGADPMSSNAQGETALHVCLRPQTFSKELVELLLHSMPDLDVQEKLNGFSALHVAAKICVSSSNKKLRMDMMEVLQLLVERADVNLCTKRGETALHRLASGSLDWTKPVQLMLEKGIDLDIQNERGETSLMCAIDRGHIAIAELLIQSGSSVNLKDKHWQTPLHRCTQKNLMKLLVLLLKSNADVNAKDLNGDTALHIAASKGLEDMVRVLVYQPGVNINARNVQGLTPLHNAVDSGFPKVVEVLLEAECEIDSDGDDLFSSVESADDNYVRPCHPEICSMLREAIEQRKDWDVGETSL